MAALTTEELYKLDKQMMHLKDMVVAGSRDLTQVRPALQDIIDGKFADPQVPEPNISQAYPLHIDSSSSLEQMVAAGSYDYVNPDITQENFPLEGKSDVEAVLVHFDRSIESEQVLSELERLGLSPASMAELAVFGATNPELQPQFPIVALGSAWTRPNGRRLVGCLGSISDDRGLYLGWFDDGWDPGCRFLAVRKSR